jgi:hypothetical protein
MLVSNLRVLCVFVVNVAFSFRGQASHKRDQTLDLFLGEIGVRRHGAGFTDGSASALNDGPDPVIGGASLPVRVRQVLRFLS